MGDAEVVYETIEPAQDSSTPPRWAKWEEEIDVLLVAILAIASLVAAWSAYQSALWGGRQSSHYAQASSRRIESTRMSTKAGQLQTVDVLTFTNFVDAYASGNDKLATFYQERFRPDFLPAFNAWMATDPINNPEAPPSPFSMAEYSLPEIQQADQLEDEASDLFQKGENDSRTRNDYVLNTVFLASVLFFAGVATRIGWIPARMALVGIATVTLLVGIINIIQFPIAT